MPNQYEDKELREEIDRIHERLHGRQRTHIRVAEQSRWSPQELDNVLQEDVWIFQAEMTDLITQKQLEARIDDLNALYTQHNRHFDIDSCDLIKDRLAELTKQEGKG
ncbi:hypothetical protein AB0280_17730 [Pseudarthrobacter sp902506025]|uniref:hypothetical protein n=1 Tax=Pseudarthrobacter sp. 902506025 TaxID=3155291 RepID=UPI00344BADAC